MLVVTAVVTSIGRFSAVASMPRVPRATRRPPRTRPARSSGRARRTGAPARGRLGHEGGVHRSLRDHRHVPDGELFALSVDPLLDRSAAHEDDLLLMRVGVEVVALARERASRRARTASRRRAHCCGRTIQPSRAPVEQLPLDVVDTHETHQDSSTRIVGWDAAGRSRQNVIALNASVWAVERRLGRQPLHARGAVEAVACRRRVCSTYAASSGIAIGPPWQSTITSSRTARAAPTKRVDRVDAVVERQRGLGADRAAGRQAHVARRRCRRRPRSSPRRRPR